MILTLSDGRDTVYLAIILRAAEEGRCVPEILEHFVDKEKTPEVMGQIRKFAKATLAHPMLKIALEEIDQLLDSYEERKTRYQRKP